MTTAHAIVACRFNDLIVDRLVHGATNAYAAAGISGDDLTVVWVPGALEAPQAMAALAATGRYATITALGAIVRGDTYHFEVVANTSAQAISDLAVSSGVVMTNGILTVDTMEQALDRAGGKHGNKGAAAAQSALATLEALNDALG